MRTRTRLTSPPGVVPEASEQETTGEVYVPAPGLPEEPGVPGRHQRKLTILGIVLALLVALYVVFRIATAGQGFDPSLDVPSQEQPADGTMPGES